MPDPAGSHDVYVREATIEDALYLSTRLRKADLEEIEASSGQPPEEALLQGFHSSKHCWVAVYNHKPFLIFGACPVVEDVGCVWALGSDDIVRARVGFLRQSAYWVKALHEDFPLLFNYIDARNTLHIRWIRWLGFKLINLHPKYGAAGIPFYEFVRIKDN